MGRHLDIIKRFEAEPSHEGCDISDISDQSPPFGRLCRFGRTPQAFARVLDALERRCPDHVDMAPWQQVIEDSRRFIAQWGEQAERLGWSSRDLFGLHPVPSTPHLSYRRLSRYDATGLIWLLEGRKVIALTEATAAIQNPSGAITIYRRHNKPALGPVGDSLDDFR